MAELFENLLEHWRKLRGAEDPAAEAYYRGEMLPRIAQRLRDDLMRTRQLPERTDLLISLSGLSPATTINAARALQPHRLVVLGSHRTREQYNVIHAAVTRPDLDGWSLQPADVQHPVCDALDPLEIYRIVRKHLGELGDPKQLRAIIDITGGKKVMSATAALAAWQLDVQLCYLDGEYNRELGMPVPGTERMVLLPTPTNLFGEQQTEAVLRLLRSGAFAHAHAEFSALAERLDNPRRVRLFRDVSAMYRAWTDLDMEAAAQAAQSVRSTLQDTAARRELRADEPQRLAVQCDWVVRLSQGDRSALLLSYFLLGLHYDGLGRHDFATLLFYRTIEGCAHQRLEDVYGIDSGKVDWGAVPGNLETLKDRYAELCVALDYKFTDLPPFLGLVAAIGVLWGLDDDLCGAIGIRRPRDLSRIVGLAHLRNQSVL